MLQILVNAYIRKRCLRAPVLHCRTDQIGRYKKVVKNEHFL